MSLPDKLQMVDVAIDGKPAGQLLKTSNYEFRYLSVEADQPNVALLMPAKARPTWQDGELFPVMEQHLPEGDLLLRLSRMFPKTLLQPMQLLAMIGDRGLGQLSYAVPQAARAPTPAHVERQALKAMSFSQQRFDELVTAHLSTGAGISGVQPKIMLADHEGASIPTVIVKAAPLALPGLAANEFLCLLAASRAGIETPDFELTDDGQMLIVDRFDLESEPTAADGGRRLARLGFEDVASLMGLRVRDVHFERKYQGSYQRIAELLQFLQLPAENLHRLFEQVALSVMVRNGDAHLKNFGILVPRRGPPRLSPVFDVATTAIYTHRRYERDAQWTDVTMALKLFAGKDRTRDYPTAAELLRFGTEVCGVVRPRTVLERIAEAMQQTLAEANGDARIPASLLSRMGVVWRDGLQLAARAEV